MSQASPFQYLSHSQYTLLAAELPGVHFPCPEQLLGQELILDRKAFSFSQYSLHYLGPLFGDWRKINEYHLAFGKGEGEKKKIGNRWKPIQPITCHLQWWTLWGLVQKKSTFLLLKCGMQKHVTSTATVEDINGYGNQFTVVYDKLDTSRTTWKMF